MKIKVEQEYTIKVNRQELAILVASVGSISNAKINEFINVHKLKADHVESSNNDLTDEVFELLLKTLKGRNR